MDAPPAFSFDLERFVPELREQFRSRPPREHARLQAALPVQGEDIPSRVLDGWNRQSIMICDGEDVWRWETPSLRALFRGDVKPSPLGDYPEAYLEELLFLELHVLTLSECLGDVRDAEMLEIYSALRRRPDGRSLGLAHDFMWQAAALLLGTRIVSQWEFEVIMGRLERALAGRSVCRSAPATTSHR